MWQDDNFVKADRLVLRNQQKRMEGDGNVQSALYNAKRKAHQSVAAPPVNGCDHVG